MTTSVAFMGLGNMGNPMAMNLLKKGYALSVFDTNPAAAANLIAAGAKGAASAAEAIANADVVFTSLPGTPERTCYTDEVFVRARYLPWLMTPVSAAFAWVFYRLVHYTIFDVH